MGHCKLCLEEKVLELSHSIPKSFFKKIKEDGKVTIIQNKKSKIHGAFDPKEYMLCRDCEQFINNEYERYGLRILRDYSKFKKNPKHIIIPSVKYEKFYLYLISILWRASLAQHEHYDTLSLGEGLEGLLRHCIYGKKIRINRLSHHRLDHVVRISIFRVVDSSGHIPDEVIRSLLTNFVQRIESSYEGVSCYFMAEGFIIFFNIFFGKDEHKNRTVRLKSQLRKIGDQKILKLEISQSRILMDIFREIVEAK